MPIRNVLPIAAFIALSLTGQRAQAEPKELWENAPPQQIHVEVTTHLGDQQQFRRGDQLSFLLSIEREAYVYMLYLDAAGNLLQIVPNQHQREARYPAGVFMPIPSADARFQFVIDAPFGEEKLWVLASSAPWPVLQGEYLANGLFRPATSPQQTLARLYEHVRSGQTAFGQASLHLRTEQ